MLRVASAQLLFFALLLVAEAGDAQESSRVLLSACEMLEHPDLYDGRILVTRLVVGNSLHSIVLFAPECVAKAKASIQPTFLPPYQIGTRRDKRFRHLLDREGALFVTVEGRFVSNGGPFGPMGRSFKMEIRALRKIDRLSSADRIRWNIGTGKLE